MAKKDINAFDKKQQFEHKRNAIIRAAAIAFNEKGYDGTSLDALAVNLGVTKKALYYYVDNKNEILKEIFLQWARLQQQAIAHATLEGKNGLDCLRVYARCYVKDVIENLTALNGINGQIRSLKPEAMEEIKTLRRENDKQLANFITQADKQSLLRQHDPAIVVKVINGSLDWMFKWFNPDGPNSLEIEVDAVMDVILKGIEKQSNA